MALAPLLVAAWFCVVLNGVMSQIGNGTAAASRPTEVNVGALFTFNSLIGRAAMAAIRLAVDDVNADPTILSGTTLKVVTQDANCSGFVGAVEALQLMQKDVIAVVGPQSSTVGHIITHTANELHVPLLSFAATDPTLSALEHPYFIRTTHSDCFQMNAIADLIEHFRWREVAIIYVDNNYGRGGVTALGDALAKKLSKISYKAGLPPHADSRAIVDLLLKVNRMSCRVYVVHVNPDSGLDIFSVAKNLGMTSAGYVWIATDWLATNLDSAADPDALSLVQGAIFLRPHTPDSSRKRKLLSSWRESNSSAGFNSYALYAYDSIWLIARAINQFLISGGAIRFSRDQRLHVADGIALRLSTLRVFNGGHLLLQQMLLTKTAGVAGWIEFDSERNLVEPAYDVVNVVGPGEPRLIGYWSNHSGLSVVAPEILQKQQPNSSASATRQELHSVVWPGGTAARPRGWVFPNNGTPLRIGVPRIASFREVVFDDGLGGLCIDVFNAAVKHLPYPVPHQFVLIGNGSKNPDYDDIINMVARNELDGVVGDMEIVEHRASSVDFTLPFIKSGLVIVTRVRESNSNAWAFSMPFTTELWFISGALFILVGAVVWLLEHRINPQFGGTRRSQIATSIWLSFSTMFLTHNQNTVTSLGRIILLIWMFAVLVIKTSYMASLTTILTIQHLHSGVTNLHSLLSTSEPIGYHEGKFTRHYLLEELCVAKSRLVPLNTPEEYAKALQLGPKNGGVAAVIEEIPYADIFLSSFCEFNKLGEQFATYGWGFAFRKDSPLAVDLSTSILKLSEHGVLQRIHDKWLSRDAQCFSKSLYLEEEANRLSLGNFWGLLLLFGAVSFLALVLFLVRSCKLYAKYRDSKAGIGISDVSRKGGKLEIARGLIRFLDSKEENTCVVIERESPSDKQRSCTASNDGHSGSNP